MSAKCNYSAKFLPLVKRMQTTKPESFKEFLDEFFNDSDRLYNMFTEGAVISTSPLTINNIDQVDNKLGLKLNTETDSTPDFYIGNNGQYSNMLRQFRAKLIESSIFNRYSGEFINANEKKQEFDITFLNDSILNYKKTLASNISKYLGNSESITLNLENLANFDNRVSEILTNFETVFNSELIDRNSAFNNAYDAYVILTQFDKLLQSEIPFITINPKYTKTNSSYVDRYIYRGPNVIHYTGFSTNEDTNAEDHASDLSKILLDYFPEVNAVGLEIDNTSITLTGFNSVMTKLIKTIQENENLIEYRSELSKGVKADMSVLIDAYINNILSNRIISKNYRTYLLDKLRGIKKFIYSPQMSSEIKAMFTQMAFKTVPSQYIAYGFDPQKKTIASRDLKERPVSQQAYDIRSLIQASGFYWRSNPDLFKEKLNQYGITIGNDRIVIESIIDNIPITFTITYELNQNGKMIYRSFGEINDQSLNNLIYNFMSFIIPENIAEIIPQVYPVEKYTKTELFVPLLATTLLDGNNSDILTKERDLLNLVPFTEDIWKVANVLSVTNGSDTINIIKNAEGNNLPLYQIISLVYNHNEIFDRLINPPTETIEHPNNVAAHNLIVQNIESGFLLSPRIRSDININGKIKKPANLKVSEVARLSIMHDFYQNLVDNLEGLIYLQPTTFSDKNKHFLITYNIGKTINTSLGEVNIKEILNNYLKGDGTLDPLYHLLGETRKNQINALVQNILFDYSLAFDTEFTSLEQIDEFIAKYNHSLKSIQSAFNAKGVDFFLDIHAYKTALSKYPRTNETIKNFFKVYNDQNKTLERLDREKRKFLKDLLVNNFNLNINQDSFISQTFNKPEFKSLVNKRNGEITLAEVTDEKGKRINLNKIVDFDALLNPKWKVKLNPILESYFITDTLLSNEYNNMMIGGVYAHPNKNKDGKLDSKEYFEFSEANRLIAQYKRMVIFGATYHPFAQNLENGVASNIKIAVINDEAGTAWNMLGDENTGLDTMDGSGLSSPLESRAENNSLLDARVGRDKKTIMHDIDSRYGRPTLLKWAVFDISNERRRISYGSDISLENIFKKMHSISINKSIILENYYNTFDPVYFKDIRTNKYYKINSIKTILDPNGLIEVVRDLTEVESNGLETNNTIQTTHIINTLYDIDQVFGGSWAMKFNEDINRLEYSESNIDILENIVNKEQLKDKFIAYLVNKSAIKVGAGNINDSSKWSNSDAFTTIEMSTKFGGVQMNADHHLDMSEVTEMTQMISALEQNGFTHELVTQIYKEIGQIVKESMNDLSETIKAKDKDQLYTILGRSLIKAFMNDDKDTLGLAQSFVYLANESFKNANLDYKLPFSAATINGAFIATTTSNLVKSGIRRKYSGIASVLVPSHNMIQYYNIDGLNYQYEELYNLVNTKGIDHLYDENGNIIKSKVERALTEPIIDGEINPFIIPIEPNDIDFEDTIVIFNEEDNPTVIKIDSLEKYYLYKHQATLGQQYYNWTIKPKNLKQSNTFFDVVVGLDGFGNEINKRFSIYDLDAVRASYYLSSRRKQLKNWEDLTEYEKTLLSSALGLHPIDNIPLNIDSLLSDLQQKIQLQLNSLADNQSIINNTAFGITNPNVRVVKVSNVNVTPTQIVMGKRQAQQFGLQKGDSIAQIRQEKENFFYNRMQSNYNIGNPDKLTYDIILFDGTGKQFYVKVLRTEEVPKVFTGSITPNPDFKIIDNIVYYNEKEFSTNDEKQFYKYTDTNGNIHDLIIINSIDRLGELRKSGLINTYQFNYTSENTKKLLPYQFRYNIENNIPITLHTRNSEGNLHEAKINPTADISYVSLNQNEIYNFNQRIKQLAFNQYEAFEKSLLHVGTRIPSQSMQSFAPMEIVMFTDSEVNDVYVAKVVTWMEGSDYDKLIMSY